MTSTLVYEVNHLATGATGTYYTSFWPKMSNVHV